MKELIWNLFKKTGDIKYYIMYKKLIKEDEIDGNKENRRDSIN